MTPKDEQEILIWKGKYGNVIVDATDQLAAFYYIFKLIDGIGYYYDIDKDEEPDQYEAYTKAKNGNRKAAKWLLEMRCEYEYEKLETDWLINPVEELKNDT